MPIFIGRGAPQAERCDGRSNLRTIDQSNLDSAGQAPIIVPDEAAWPAWINEIQSFLSD